MWLLLVNYCRRFCIEAGTKQKWQYDHHMCKINFQCPHYFDKKYQWYPKKLKMQNIRSQKTETVAIKILPSNF